MYVGIRELPVAFLWRFGSELFVDYSYYCVWKLIQLSTLNWQQEYKENTTFLVCVEKHNNRSYTVAHKLNLFWCFIEILL